MVRKRRRVSYGPLLRSQGAVTTTGATVIANGPVVTATLPGGAVVTGAAKPRSSPAPAFAQGNALTQAAEAEAAIEMANEGIDATDSTATTAEGPLVVPSISQISSYNVTSIPLDPLPGWHGGTAVLTDERLLIDPYSVPGTGLLRFFTADATVTTLLFQLATAEAPNWFAAVVPSGVTDFTKPNLFFHPIPAQAGYQDADYADKTGMWPELFYYMQLLGFQAAAALEFFSAAPNQIVIMPFLTSAATNTGILPASWFDIVTDILTDIRYGLGGGDATTVDISELVVSSFSNGYVYSEAFRASASHLGVLKQVWDFDGHPISDSNKLVTTKNFEAIKYQSSSGTPTLTVQYLPSGRWNAYPNPQPAGYPDRDDIHHLVRDFMFLHAATLR